MKKNIVLLDDDLMSLRSLEHTLKEWGYNTVSFSEYNQAFKDHNFEQVNCVIVDYHLQGDNGISVLQSLKTTNPNIRRLLISGYNINESILSQNKSYFDFFLPKPINITKLNTILKKTNKEKK
ncbi:MAG TPA: response regulator [Candidatus Cloacimonadota bacterium]|nr:response regulator [Candidatus Cloacimonadota bacterium]HOQ79723.1 response regulator [Candidatus Cloacimonadota bacterium]HPK40463.1 response regulator [Candidatus Cloacimonadota bacterium]